MNIKASLYEKEIKIKQSTFPAGERYLKVEDESLKFITQMLEEPDECVIHLYLLSASSDAIFDAILFSNAINEEFNHEVNIDLIADYLPYSRQDRVCNAGESFSLKVFLNMISPYFRSIFTTDVHNPEVIKNISKYGNVGNIYDCEIEYNNFTNVYGEYEKLKDILQKDTYLVAVDKGSVERVVDAAEALRNKNDIIYFDKIRKDGKIQSILKDDAQIELIKSAKRIIIIDDICDGGNTFIKNAEQINKYNPEVELILVVSHGIFSAGLDRLKEYYDSVFVLDTEYNKQRLTQL